MLDVTPDEHENDDDRDEGENDSLCEKLRISRQATDEMRVTLEQTVERVNMEAQLIRARYDALIACKFTAEQAFDFIRYRGLN